MKFKFIFLGLALCSGCSVMKGLDETKKTTKEVKNLTQEVVNISKGLDTKTANMEKTTGSMYHDMRMAESLKSRNDALTALIAEKDLQKKVSWAAKYFGAFEYLFLKMDNIDTPEHLENLKESAINELFRDLNPLFQQIGMLDKMVLSNPHPVDGSNGLESLSALSLAMHQTNTNHESWVEHGNKEPLSMYKIFTEALAEKNKFEKGESVSKATKEVLYNEKKTIYLLKLRYNMLICLTLREISKIKGDALDGPDSEFDSKIFKAQIGLNYADHFDPSKVPSWLAKIFLIPAPFWAKVFGLHDPVTFSWSPEFKKMSVAELRKTSLILEKLEDVYKVLRSLGYRQFTADLLKESVNTMDISKIDRSYMTLPKEENREYWLKIVQRRLVALKSMSSR